MAQIQALIPPWTRVYRIQRDIPMPLVTSGISSYLCNCMYLYICLSVLVVVKWIIICGCYGRCTCLFTGKSYMIQITISTSSIINLGVENGNLRELALARMEELDLQCRDVRTREVGMKQIHQRLNPDQIELIRRDYTANQGWETFISYEDPVSDILIGWCLVSCLSTWQCKVVYIWFLVTASVYFYCHEKLHKQQCH